ncbi:MAG: LuxR C-terminal-related transcriptional regulator [Verrucomicrobiota bacterium]|jgi:DNA-binding NarL/FixJ family response regulator
MAGLQKNRQVRPPLGAAMFSEQEWEKVARTLTLTKRELQIIRGVFDDRTEYAIAADLGMSQHTVHNHFDHLHRKLAVHTRAAMVLRVMHEFSTLKQAPVRA